MGLEDALVKLMEEVGCDAREDVGVRKVDPERGIYESKTFVGAPLLRCWV